MLGTVIIPIVQMKTVGCREFRQVVGLLTYKVAKVRFSGQVLEFMVVITRLCVRDVFRY